ncbi:MAG: DNA translocase FtsK [Chitinispirillia bacterium]|nr:DNA translocase FtsK [Chitinispirillia bacterium]
MSRKKIETAPAKGDSSNVDSGKKDSVIIHGIWGLVYLSIGILVIISILFYSQKQLEDSANVHLLGPYLGTSLSLGLFFLFGRIPAFLFGAAVTYIGWAKLRSNPLRLKLLLFLAVLSIELCLLLAIRHMPELSAGATLTIDSQNIRFNYVGLLMVQALVPLFGGRVFGPYFITLILVIITLMVGLRIRPQTIAAFIAKWALYFWVRVKEIFVDVKRGIESSPDIVQQSGSDGGDAGAVVSEESNISEDESPDKPGKRRSRKRAGKVDDTSMETDSAVQISEYSENPADEESLPKYTEEESAAVAAAVGEQSDAFTAASWLDDLTSVSVSPKEEENNHQQEEENSSFDKMEDAPIKILTIETVDVEPQMDDDDFMPPLVVDDDQEYGEMADTSTREFDHDELHGEDDSYGSDNSVDLDDEEKFVVTEEVKLSKPYVLPPPDLLAEPEALSKMYDEDEIKQNSMILERTLESFNVKGKVRAVSPGPVVIRYEIELAPGVKVNKITGLHDDISLAVGGKKIRIQAPIPGKAAVGIEMPNGKRQNVHFKHILVSDTFKKDNSKLPVIIGSNISGLPYVTDIAKTPHLLVAGQTGSGKSVCMNSLICTLLMTKTPDELRLILIDPKQVEFTSYENIPHLLAPVVTESKEAIKALQWGVIEMERRYSLFVKAGARKIDDFNEKFESGKLAGVVPDEDNKPMPFIVIIIDELADLMAVASKDIEALISRIAAKARAAGMHLILATQSPRVTVITGPIKANLPSRIAFRTVQSNDSKTILDRNGAEDLLGMGDMLFLRNGASDVERFHGAFIPDSDVENIVGAIREQQVEIDTIGSFNDVIADGEDGGDSGGGTFDDGKRDEKFKEAAYLIASIGQGSTSLLQRKLEIGFARAGRLMDQLESFGVVAPGKGSKAREVLMRTEDLDDLFRK